MAFQISDENMNYLINNTAIWEKMKFYSYNKINLSWPKILKHKQAQEKKSLTTLIIREMQNKTTLRYPFPTYQIGRVKKMDTIQHRWGVEEHYSHTDLKGE